MKKRVLAISCCYDCPYISPKYSDGYYCFFIAVMTGKEYHINTNVKKGIPDDCKLMKLEYCDEKTIIGKC